MKVDRRRTERRRGRETERETERVRNGCGVWREIHRRRERDSGR